MESISILELRQTVDRLQKAHMFQKADIATSAVNQSLEIIAAQERRLKELEKRVNNIQGL